MEAVRAGRAMLFDMMALVEVALDAEEMQSGFGEGGLMKDEVGCSGEMEDKDEGDDDFSGNRVG